MSLHGLHRRVRGIESITRAQVWRVIHPGIDIGRDVRIGRGCRLFLDAHAHLVVGDGCIVDDGSTIAVYGEGRIELGAGSFVGHHCTLAAHDAIELGSGAYLAELVSIRDHDHTVGLPPSSGRVTIDRVVIGASAWIGAKATVIRGSRVGEGAVVAANAVVRGELPPWTVCAGIPARVVRTYDPSSAPATPEAQR